MRVFQNNHDSVTNYAIQTPTGALVVERPVPELMVEITADKTAAMVMETRQRHWS